MLAKLSVMGLAAVGLLASIGIASKTHTCCSCGSKTQCGVSGDYVEIRSCDVYTGHCFANAETNLDGKEAIMAWSIRNGAFDGVNLEGLKVVAVVEANGTLGDVANFPQETRSVLIVDEAANCAQRAALVHFAQKRAGGVLGTTVRVDSAPMSVEFPASCSKAGCANVQAGDLVNIQTRCMAGNDHVCGNEELYYPPLTTVADARAAFITAGVFRGQGLGVQFDEANRRGAYLATFSE